MTLCLQKQEGSSLAQLCKDADFQIGGFLDGEGAQPSAAEFLKSKGLEEAVLQ